MATVVDAPYKWLRLSSLALTCVWAIVAASVGLNALVKSNREKSRVLHAIPPPTVVIIDTHDILNSGAVLTAVATLIAITSVIFLSHQLLTSVSIRNGKASITTLSTDTSADTNKHTPPEIQVHPSARALWIQSLGLGFFGIWLLGTLVPFTMFFATRSARVRASLRGQELSPTLIATVEHSLGVTTVYREISYLRLVSVLPWFTMLFTIFSAALLFLSSLDIEFVRQDFQREACARMEKKPEGKDQPPAAEP